MKLFNNYPFSSEINFVKPDLNFTTHWRNFVGVKMGTTASRRGLRAAALGTLMGCAGTKAQPALGETCGHKWCKTWVQPWFDAVSELLVGLQA